MGIPRNPVTLGLWGFGIVFFAFLVFWTLDSMDMPMALKLVGALISLGIGAWLMLINND